MGARTPPGLTAYHVTMGSQMDNIILRKGENWIFYLFLGTINIFYDVLLRVLIGYLNLPK